MCYRTQINAKLKDIEKAFEATFAEPEAFSPMEEINAFDFLKTPVITNENRGEIQQYNWGLIPFWAKDDKIKKMTLNSKIETATEKPAFKNSVSNRCLVIATGYYEWQWLDAKGKNKQKYFIRPTDQEIFAFAGIYSTWKDPQQNEFIDSYSILTTEANELMSEIHNNKQRMPVVIKKGDEARWLEGADLQSFAFPYEVELAASKV